MSIQPAAINRDPNGYWVHPQLPEWDEGTTQEDIDKWFSKHSLSYEVIRLETKCTQEQYDRYYRDGEIDMGDWEPTCDVPGSFLLSIHETDDGPVAIFAFSIEHKTEPSKLVNNE